MNKSAAISNAAIGDLKKMLQDTGWRRESFTLFPASPIIVFIMRDNT